MKLLELLVMGDYGRKENITIDSLDSEETKLILDLMETYVYEQGASTGSYEEDTCDGRRMMGLLESVANSYQEEFDDVDDEDYEPLFTHEEIEQLETLIEIDVHSFEVKHNKETDKLDVEIRCFD